MPNLEINHEIRLAIDDIYGSLQVNGKQTDLTDHLVNYLTANIDDVREYIEEEVVVDDLQCGFCGNDHQDCVCGHE